MSEKRRVVKELHDLYRGSTVWIVGKGPSLRFLRAEHFGEGPIITINESILIVERLGLCNPIYSMQKDGRKMYYPHPNTTAILQDDFSEHCLPLHALKLFMDPVSEMGFDASEMSIRLCIAIARLMGCGAIMFVCCDSLCCDDFNTYDVISGEISNTVSGHYAYVAPLVMEDVKYVRHEFVTPMLEGVQC